MCSEFGMLITDVERERVNRTLVDDDDDMTMNRERKSNLIMNQRRELIRLFKLIVIVTGCLESDCLFL